MTSVSYLTHYEAMQPNKVNAKKEKPPTKTSLGGGVRSLYNKCPTVESDFIFHHNLAKIRNTKVLPLYFCIQIETTQSG